LQPKTEGRGGILPGRKGNQNCKCNRKANNSNEIGNAIQTMLPKNMSKNIKYMSKYKISATTRANKSSDYKRLNLQRRLFTRILLAISNPDSVLMPTAVT
jgi:hypothetical protein